MDVRERDISDGERDIDGGEIERVVEGRKTYMDREMGRKRERERDSALADKDRFFGDKGAESLKGVVPNFAPVLFIKK